MIASYAYYFSIGGGQILSDADFDECCKIFNDNYDKIDHIHKHLIDLGPPVHVWLKDVEYPSIVKEVIREYIS